MSYCYCQYCGKDINEESANLSQAVADGFEDELVIHYLDGDEPFVVELAYAYCNPDCFVAAAEAGELNGVGQ